MVSSDGSTITDLGTTVKASSVSQLESLARQIDSLESMYLREFRRVTYTVSVAKVFEASGRQILVFKSAKAWVIQMITF